MRLRFELCRIIMTSINHLFDTKVITHSMAMVIPKHKASTRAALQQDDLNAHKDPMPLCRLVYMESQLTYGYGVEEFQKTNASKS